MIKTPSPTITVRRTTALPKKRAEIEKQLTLDGVEKFLKTVGKGAFEAEIIHDPNDAAADAAGTPQSEKLTLGDIVTVRLPNLEFAGLAGFAQLLATAKAPAGLKPFLENTPMFRKVGESLDAVYSAVRGGLTFRSKITEWNSTPESLVYVDEGVQLPRPLKAWKHTHTIAEQGDGAMIVDEIQAEVDPAIASPVVEGALRLHLERCSKAYQELFTGEAAAEAAL